MVASESHWDVECSAFERRMHNTSAGPSELFSDPDGTALVAASTFEAFEGDYGVAPYLMLTLCLDRVGRIRRAGGWGNVEGTFRPGRVVVALPNTKAQGFTPKARVLGIGIDPRRAQDTLSDTSGLDALLPAAESLHEDPLISSVMIALWRDAQAHGLSSAFFDHGLDLILRRLVALDRPATGGRQARPLCREQLQRAVELIDSRLESDLRVEEIASELGRDVRSVTRAFRATTGYAPYEYLTFRRMERAKQLLATDATILDVALSVGYANPSKFSAAFRRFCGRTPSEWRRGLT